MVSNEDLEIMIKIEYLIMSENRLNMIKELNENGKCYFNDIEINDNDINRYWNIIDMIKKNKATRNEKQKVWNKNHKEIHRLNNNISNNRVSGNIEKMEYWQEELKKYKESKER